MIVTDCRFDGRQIRGHNEGPDFEPPGIAVKRRFFWGFRGEVSIFGGQKGRPIRVRIYLQGPEPDSGDSDEGTDGLNLLYEEMRRLEAAVGDCAQLSVSTEVQGQTFTWDFDDTRFHGFQPLALPGQDFVGPLNTMCGVSGWFQYGVLSFYQLNPRFTTI